MKLPDNIKDALKNIKIVISDCDGVLTDGGLYYMEDGTECRKFQVLDGMGFLRLQEKGIKTGIVTRDKTDIVEHRAKKLKVDFFVKGTLDKLQALTEISQQENIPLEQFAYIGDDIFDIEAIRGVGFGCAPASAAEAIKSCSRYVTEKSGGEGCFRELAELILEVREEYEGSSICND